MKHLLLILLAVITLISSCTDKKMSNDVFMNKSKQALYNTIVEAKKDHAFSNVEHEKVKESEDYVMWLIKGNGMSTTIRFTINHEFTPKVAVNEHFTSWRTQIPETQIVIYSRQHIDRQPILPLKENSDYSLLDWRERHDLITMKLKEQLMNEGITTE